MRWRKLGLVFRPTGRGWLASHAANPVAVPLGGGRYRVYYASRDADNRSHVGATELDVTTPGADLQPLPHPCLGPGELGCFDDHGTYAASAVVVDGRVLLYYTGWNPSLTRPVFYTAVGLAESDDGGLTFRKRSTAPLLARCDVDPWMISQPCVLLDDGLWRMWYISGLRWEEVGGELHSYYHLKYAESPDGIEWRREGRVAVELGPGEKNIARPCVVKRDGGGYEMWYSYNRGAGYRIGYAESADGLTWERRDEQAGLEASEWWDSDAQAYPWVFYEGGRRHLLYNGNGFGRDGFGLAVEEP